MESFLAEKGERENTKPDDSVERMYQETMCPFIEMHSDECYCINMNSQTIPNAINYCMRNFEQCKRYRMFEKSRSCIATQRAGEVEKQ